MRILATRVTALATASLLAASCAPPSDDAPTDQMQVQTEQDAIDAFATSLTNSFEWAGRATFDIAEADRAAFDPGDLQELDRMAEWAERHHAIGALGDDRSWRLAFVDGDVTWLDLRLGIGELLTADTLEPDTSVFLRLDLIHIVTEFDRNIASRQQAVDELAEMRDTYPQWLGDSPLTDVVLAIIDGGWGGVAGTLDLAELELTDGDLARAQADWRDEFVGAADRDDVIELLDTAVTVRNFEPDGTGGSTATIDLHPRAAAFAIYDLFDDATALAATADPQRLPTDLEGAASLAFDREGHLTAVTTDVLAIARQVEEHEQATRPADDADIYIHRDPLTEQMANLSDQSTMTVTFSFANHGNVTSVLDVPDAVTTDWTSLAEGFASMFGFEPQHYDDVVVSEPGEEEFAIGDLDLAPGSDAIDGVTLVSFELMTLVARADEQQRRDGRYDPEQLVAQATPREDVFLRAAASDGDTYCIEGYFVAPGAGIAAVPDAVLDAELGLVVGEGITCAT